MNTMVDAALRASRPAAQAFREAMAQVASAAHIVTTLGAGGRAGLTATAVASVSDAPPTVLVCIEAVRDNIVLAREDSSYDAVREALRAVGSLAWVERLPDGLDTMIGSGRFALTPAQAQQVALARLIIADPHTLVLDEATSLIDPRTARTLEGSMNNLLEGRTVVAIAHRLHTAHDADRIAVVLDGRIVELGSHDELLDLDGEYADLWHAWTS